MITSAFLNIFFDAVNFLVNKLPDVTMNSNFIPSITTASSYISSVYAFLPFITITLLAIIVFDIVFESGYLFFKVLYWVIRRFPTQS